MVPEQRIHLKGKRQKQVAIRRLWQSSRKEVMRAGIMETKKGDGFSRKYVGGKLGRIWWSSGSME